MIERSHFQPGKFNWRCLFRHLWGAWAGPVIRHYPEPSLDEYLWKQRTCKRCEAKQGVEIPSLE